MLFRLLGRQWSAKTELRPLVIAISVLIGGLLLTAIAVREERRAAHAAEYLHFVRLVDRMSDSIHERIAMHEHMLRGIRGLFGASTSVERHEIRKFVSSIERPHSGELGYGFIRYVNRDELPDFLNRTRADGAPEFMVKSKGDASELFIIEYIEPLADNTDAEGLDIRQEESRRTAAELAVIHDKAIITAKIALVQDREKLPGFLLLLPIYKNGALTMTEEQRWNALIGWAYAPLRIDGLLKGLMESAE